eukprot:TRINITY_DN846_c0_g6_i1.p1 TRINITY_DN846_c0_g6~~TRINITY_DN846_c0_g6_i1.p1  ORF type:complete len:741 (+),score=154.55 TRINITY_DN846_c0_g6_i1:67-2289(+)
MMDYSGGNTSDGQPKIKVIVRKRPLTKKETAKNDVDIIDVRDEYTVGVREIKTKVDLTKYIEEHVFTFDRVFDDSTTNEQLYYTAVRPIVDAAFAKAKVTCFAYGQTGSGKTFTMMGDPNREVQVPGLYALASYDIFDFLQRVEFSHLGVYVSFYEIYCGKLHDLLNDRALLHAREDAKQNVNIVGLQEKRVTNVHSLLQIIEFGSSIRVTGVTGANVDSSRSHAILQIAIKDGERLHGKISFIDLAGSERGADTVDQNKQTRMDGAEINKSLLALKECIRALDQDKRHTPFRGSKLTMVLKDSFTGNCRTVMIGNFSPAQSNCEHTLNTLRYADRVKELKKAPTDLPGQLTQLDKMARELMLPRQATNVSRTVIENSAPGQSNATVPLNVLMHKKANAPQNPPPPQPMFTQPQPQPHPQPYPQMQHGYQMPGLFQHVNNGAGEPMIEEQNVRPLTAYVKRPMMPTQQLQHQPQPQPQLQPQAQPQPPQPMMARQMPPQPTPAPNYPPFQNGNFRGHGQGQGQGLFQSVGHPQQQMHQMPQQMPQMPQMPQQMPQLPQMQQQMNYGGYSPQVNQVPQNGLFQTPMHLQQQPSMQQMLPAGGQVQSGRVEDNLYLMSQKHEQLISLILSEEEEMINSHRSHIDDMVDLVKQEMLLLHEVDKPGSDVDEYVENLDAILLHKLELITGVRNRLQAFRTHLKEEEELSKRFYEHRSEVLDVFDLENNAAANMQEDVLLIQNLPQ